MVTTTENESIHISEVTLASKCPICKCENLSVFSDFLECYNCNNFFTRNSVLVDFVSSTDDKTNNRAKKLWGEELHSNEFSRGDSKGHLFNLSKKFSTDVMIGNSILEIGCGSGSDALYITKNFSPLKYFALDIGTNLFSVSERDKEVKNLHYIRANCLNLPLSNNFFDVVISYGVFHHTSDPLKCMFEAFRVLKPGGEIFVYLYKNHEDNPLKFLGIKIEKMIMFITSKLSVGAGKFICWLISPFILIIFSWPALILKSFRSTNRIGYSFPLNWGTTPQSIIPDLMDRLLSPVNHRFSRKKFIELFNLAGFSKVHAITDNTGHYGYAIK